METSLGLKIKELRKKKGLSQEALAEKINVSKQAFSKYESNKVRIDWNSLLIIAKEIDGDMKELEKLWLTFVAEPENQPKQEDQIRTLEASTFNPLDNLTKDQLIFRVMELQDELIRSEKEKVIEKDKQIALLLEIKLLNEKLRNIA